MKWDVAIEKTALDALHAKVSLVSVGYRPTRTQSGTLTRTRSDSPLHNELDCNNKDDDSSKSKSTGGLEDLDLDTAYENLLWEMFHNIQAMKDHNPKATFTCEGPKSKEQTRIRRQTPLVNAGYAVRVSLLTSVLKNLLVGFKSQSIKGEDSRIVNVMILGGGFDIIGSWLVIVAERLKIELRIFELDGSSNSRMKQRCLSMNNSTVQVNEDGDVLIKGCSVKHKYSCIECDLRNIADVHNAIFGSKKKSLNPLMPTIILSELVLSYLGGVAARGLVRFLSSKILIADNSCFIAYEVKGGIELGIDQYSTTPKSLDKKCMSFSTFDQRYCEMFQEKLDRGKSLNEIEERFNSVTESASSIVNEFRDMLDDVFVMSAHDAAMYCCTKMEAPEMFDEFTALNLHLQCYTVTAAFSPNTSLEFVEDTLSCWRSELQQAECKATVSIQTVEKRHHDEVRRLFQSTYSFISNENKAIRKMIKTALKTDLKSVADALSPDESSIRHHYNAAGGNFLVASLESQKLRSGDGDVSEAILGFIGVKKCNQTEHMAFLPKNSKDHVYEIHRLAVDKDFRRMKVGSRLMKSLLKWLKDSLCIQAEGDPQIYMIATTLSILKEANQFYVRHGFELIEEKKAGTLVYNLFLLKITKD